MVIGISSSLRATLFGVLCFASLCSFAGNAWPAGETIAVAGSPLTLVSAASSDAQPDDSQRAAGSAAAVPPFRSFRTKYAHFEPARFSDLPGWHEDNVAEAWRAFRASCGALANRAAWSAMCQRSTEVRIRNDEIRRFFEREFVLYQIRNQDRSEAGIITGYYEPLLNGSRRRMGRYIHPVYGVPGDLLYLDSRSVPRASAGGPQYARVEGRMVIPSLGGRAAGAPRNDLLVLDLGNVRPDIRDKKLRVRIERDRIVPYYTRREIEEGALDAGPVLVWVDDAAALYSMQVQGSGKVRLPDGKLVRLSYAEQNGHPFLPPVQGWSRASRGNLRIPETRGIPLLRKLAGEDVDGVGGGQANVPETPATRGGRSKAGTGTDSGALSARARDPVDTSPDVARVVELLLKSARPSAAATDDPAPKIDSGQPRARIKKNASASETASAAPLHASPSSASPLSSTPLTPSPLAPSPSGASPAYPVSAPTTFSSDPSYVFFRQVPDTAAGPVGALGVPLTAGRSIAVDPRTTPLGFPVFVATRDPAGAQGLNRLMIAQDTGGAIRGAVRADYFWGFGPGAGERAARMKQLAQMWLLMPKEQQLPASLPQAATRGADGVGHDTGDAECVIADPELCVE